MLITKKRTIITRSSLQRSKKMQFLQICQQGITCETTVFQTIHRHILSSADLKKNFYPKDNANMPSFRPKIITEFNYQFDVESADILQY
jgi:hypothetical protein